jgi:hypothetical protein
MVQIPRSPHSKIKISRPAGRGICPQKSAAQSLTVILRGLTRPDFGKAIVPALRWIALGFLPIKTKKAPSWQLGAW